MDWSRQIDIYCERTDFSYWSEPLNALTNVAFIIAAVVMFGRVRGLRGAQLLCAILFAIGVGSYLFHTHATIWASTADVVPIGLFILTYLFLVNWHVLRWRVWIAALGTAAFVPYAAVVVAVMNEIPFLRISNFYWTVPILLVIYATAMRRKHPRSARGFAIGAGILTLSICARSVDASVCAQWPIGTHIAWHILNAIMLGWMIEVYRQHMVERTHERR